MATLSRSLTRLGLAVAVAALAAQEARAQEESRFEQLSLEDLLRVRVTTATGGLALESDVVPANVVTITDDDIANHNWRSIGEVLQNVPGLYVIDNLVFYDVSVRGVS